MSAAYASLREYLADYGRRWPDEQAVTAQCLALLDEPVNPFVRERLEGHLTGGAWLVSGDGRRIPVGMERTALFYFHFDKTSIIQGQLVIDWITSGVFSMANSPITKSSSSASRLGKTLL